MASGAPVIGLAKGGLLDTVNCLTDFPKNKIYTGLLFKEQNSCNIKDTVNWFEEKRFGRNLIQKFKMNLQRNFRMIISNLKLDKFINKSLERFSKN